MKTVLTLSVLALISFASFAQADQTCQDNVNQRKEELKKVEDRYNAGEATIIELLDSKIALADQMYACGTYVKVNYCKYKIDLVNAKIRNLSGSDQDAAKQQLSSTKAFCLDPK